MMRAYRIAGQTATESSPRKPAERTERVAFGRSSGSIRSCGRAAARYSDFLIHNLDECCWMKNAWPVEAQALGGRHYRGENVDQNFDTYAVEYTFARRGEVVSRWSHDRRLLLAGTRAWRRARRVRPLFRSRGTCRHNAGCSKARRRRLRKSGDGSGQYHLGVR